MNKRTLLKRAEGCFLKKDYTSALKLYSLLLDADPQLGDARVGACLCDLGSESDEEAQALFDYYQSIKEETEDPEGVIDQLLMTLNATRVIIQEELFDAGKNEAVYEDGIEYRDFLQLIEEKGDFKSAFEDTIFSTRVIISERKDFIDFLKRLIAAGYENMAADYLDAFSDSYGNDQEILALYALFGKEKA